ncbi:YbaY family lipoprotein [Frateuria aurantia]
MRTSALSVISVAALALAGCQSSESSKDAAAAAAPVASSVSGTITIAPGGAQPSDQAKLELSVVDAANPSGTPLAAKEIKPAAQFPLKFDLPVNAQDVNPADLYVVHAEIIDGERHFVAPLQAPVLTQGKPASVTVQLAPVPTDGEKAFASFTALRSRIGGLKVSNGTKLESGDSLAWQVFRDGSSIKFIRELVDYQGKHFTSTDFAYNNGKVWAAVQDQKATHAAPTDVEQRAVWGDDGKLVLNESKAGGKSSPLSDADVQALQKQAQTIYELAGGK